MFGSFRRKCTLLAAASLLAFSMMTPAVRAQFADEPAADPQQQIKESEAVKHFDISGFYFHNWKLPLAEVELEEAIGNWPEFKAAHRDLCLVSLFRGQPMRALAEMMMVVGLGDPIPLNAQEKADLDKKAMTLHYNRGVEWGTAGKWKDSIAEFGWALSYAPNDARIHRSLAFAYANDGNFNLAEQQYGASFGLDPNDPYGHADFANVLQDKGQQDKAMQQMAQAVKLAPSAAALHVDMGWLAESKGDLAKADQEFHEAVTLSPGHAGLWTHWGRILEREGKPDKALLAYEKALALDPGHDEARARISKLKAS